MPDIYRLLVMDDESEKKFILVYMWEGVKNHVRVFHELFTRMVVAQEQSVQIQRERLEIEKSFNHGWME